MQPLSQGLTPVLLFDVVLFINLCKLSFNISLMCGYFWNYHLLFYFWLSEIFSRGIARLGLQ